MRGFMGGICKPAGAVHATMFSASSWHAAQVAVSRIPAKRIDDQNSRLRTLRPRPFGIESLSILCSMLPHHHHAGMAGRAARLIMFELVEDLDSSLPALTPLLSIIRPGVNAALVRNVGQCCVA